MTPTAGTEPDPFDPHAGAYPTCWETEPTAMAQRRAIQAVLGSTLPPGARVLDLGCGTGIDAAWLLSTGRQVVARDASPGMVMAARARGVPAELLCAEQLPTLKGPPFEGAVLNFGVLNCIPDLPVLARDLFDCLLPRAPLFLITMPRLSPAWLLGALKRGRLRSAWERMKSEARVDVEGSPVLIRYHHPPAIIKTFSPGFTLEDQLGLGFLLPPPGSRSGVRWSPRLNRLEAPLRRLPFFRSIGDHVLIVLRRT